MAIGLAFNNARWYSGSALKRVHFYLLLLLMLLLSNLEWQITFMWRSSHVHV